MCLGVTSGCAAAQLLVLRGKTLEELAGELARWRPNLVYFDKGASPTPDGAHQTLCDLSLLSDSGEGARPPLKINPSL